MNYHVNLYILVVVDVFYGDLISITIFLVYMDVICFHKKSL